MCAQLVIAPSLVHEKDNSGNPKDQHHAYQCVQRSTKESVRLVDFKDGLVKEQCIASIREWFLLRYAEILSLSFRLCVPYFFIWCTSPPPL